MSNDFANPRCSLCGSLLHFTDQHPDTPALTAELEREIRASVEEPCDDTAVLLAALDEARAALDRERAARAQVLEVLRDMVTARDAEDAERCEAAIDRARALLTAEDK